MNKDTLSESLINKCLSNRGMQEESIDDYNNIINHNTFISGYGLILRCV